MYDINIITQHGSGWVMLCTRSAQITEVTESQCSRSVQRHYWVQQTRTVYYPCMHPVKTFELTGRVQVTSLHASFGSPVSSLEPWILEHLPSNSRCWFLLTKDSQTGRRAGTSQEALLNCVWSFLCMRVKLPAGLQQLCSWGVSSAESTCRLFVFRGEIIIDSADLWRGQSLETAHHTFPLVWLWDKWTHLEAWLLRCSPPACTEDQFWLSVGFRVDFKILVPADSSSIKHAWSGPPSLFKTSFQP